ncbi:MAG: Abi family protein [Methylacidiphilales bacterium]|nr:Abi family protein [Candidatus Methylacidiphilales bacterium]
MGRDQMYDKEVKLVNSIHDLYEIVSQNCIEIPDRDSFIELVRSSFENISDRRSKTKFNHPVLNGEDFVDILKKRGLTFDKNEAEFINFIDSVNYHRFKNYLKPLLVIDSRKIDNSIKKVIKIARGIHSSADIESFKNSIAHSFPNIKIKKGASWEIAYSYYLIDAQLREIVLSAVCYFEITLRSILVDIFKYEYKNHHGYKAIIDELKVVDLCSIKENKSSKIIIDRLYKLINNYSKSKIMKYYEAPPMHYLLEESSFGNIIDIIKLLYLVKKEDILLCKFKLGDNRNYFTDFMIIIKTLRNNCAHNKSLLAFNYVRKIKTGVSINHNISHALLIIEYLFFAFPNSKIKQDIKAQYRKKLSAFFIDMKNPKNDFLIGYWRQIGIEYGEYYMNLYKKAIRGDLPFPINRTGEGS